MHLRRIRDQVTRRYGVSFAEVGHQDLWQRSRVVMAAVASDPKVVDEKFDRVREYLDSQEWVMTSSACQMVDIDA